MSGEQQYPEDNTYSQEQHEDSMQIHRESDNAQTPPSTPTTPVPDTPSLPPLPATPAINRQDDGTSGTRPASSQLPFYYEARQERIRRAQHYLEQKSRRHQRLSQSAENDGSQNSPAEQSQLPQPYASANNMHTRGRNGLLIAQRRRKLLLRHISRKHLRSNRKQTHRAFNRFWLSVFSILGAIILLIFTITSAGSYATYHFYNSTSSSYNQQLISLHDLTPHDNLKIYDSKSVLLSQITDQGMHTSVTLNQVSPQLINATVATEDKNFWNNSGIDVFRILQAAIQNLEHGRVIEGGSTITQQLIKNLVVGNEASLMRKMQEIVLTPEINGLYSKNDILEMYLNTIYYGHQAYGIDAAATMYFGLVDQPGKPASAQLDLAQSAMLAGMPSSPWLYDPSLHPQTAFNRFNTVLTLMIREGYITQEQAQDALKEAQKSDFFKGPPNLNDRAPHFSQYVIQQLEQQLKLSRGQLSRSGLKVYTTLDIGLQDKIQKVMQTHIAELGGHNVTNAAEVLIDYHSGAIRSLLGSLDYNSKTIDGKFDVATMGYRQPGSSFKPYVYATALEQGYTPAQAIDDAPLTIVLPPGSNPPTYSPKNYDQLFHGHVTMRCALQNSLNIPAVKTLQHVGIGNALKTARDMGIEHPKGDAGYSMVLGGLGVNLLEHTTAFGAFANNGQTFQPYAIDKIVYTYNNKVITHQTKPGKRAISPQIAYMMTSMLSDNDSRLPEFLDCNPLQLYTNSESQCWAGNRGTVRPAAAKTGTTNDFRDNWTMGYTSDFVMGVWAGNNNYTPMLNVTGVQGAAPIWHDSMLLAEEEHPIKDFVNPGGLERGDMTYPDGIHTTDWYLPGHYPTFTQMQTLDPAATIIPMKHKHKHHKKVHTSVNTSIATEHPYCNNFNFVAPPPGNSTPHMGWW
ncbi:transglycosylase domain-containing protein [Dictyobacter formicarum]|uniref:Penicillin-insensitive transglycosylase n=1 Tax=Dictyobacter formicarum TaxID=2778368 RepID=A0ABQ3VRK4_9CHLR|nr:PBP1A family penicillin-binding protein [Dictyobacter formicarum]GHO88339.1 hypothetical protein KSZ_63450 [Dictyobacter formicarum]